MPFQQLRGLPYHKAVHREKCVPVAVPHSCTLLLKRPAQLCGEVMCQRRAVCGSMRASLPYDSLFRFPSPPPLGCFFTPSFKGTCINASF